MSEALLNRVAHRFAVLAEPMRLRLLRDLMDGERSVNDLADSVGGTQTNVSRHLKTMVEGGVLKRRREGLLVFYSIADPSVYELCSVVCGCASFMQTGALEDNRS